MRVPPRPRSFGSSRRPARPRLEHLEARLVLDASSALGGVAGKAVASIVGDTLVVQGTPRPDRIQIVPTQQAGTFRVIDNGRVLGSFGPATNININAGGGNDTVMVDPRVTVPTQLDGGAGNDLVRGGSGPNLLEGGDGRNTLIGNPTRDTFDNSSAQNRLVFTKDLGMIQVGPSASGTAVRGLSGPFALRPLQVTGPAIVGANDLRNGRIVNLLKNDFSAGQTVAVTNATAADAAALASTIGYKGQVALPDGVDRADMVAFQQADQGGRTLSSISILLPPDNVPTRPSQLRAGNRVSNTQALRGFQANVFSTTPSIPTPPPIADPQSNLISLANASLSRVFKNNGAHGDSIQLLNTVYAARSFDNQADFYYVIQEVQDTIADSAIGKASNGFGYVTAEWGNGVGNKLQGLTSTDNVATIQPSPGTTQTTKTETSGVSFTIGGSAGFNQAQGFNVGINGSLTISNSTTKSVPPINIVYQGTPGNGNTVWSYNIGSDNLPQPRQTMSFVTGWIWEVPFSAYTPGQSSLSFGSDANLVYFNPLNPPNPFNPPNNTPWMVAVDLTSSVPFPFGTNFKLGTPTVTSVSPATVKPGDTFTIEGQALYPSTVQAVLIKGQSLSTGNFKPVSDTRINVVAPNTPGSSLPVVVQTSQGTSNSDVTINIVGATQLHVQAQPIAAIAGQAFTNQTVATVTDSVPNANPADLAATINWGDSSSSAGTITAAGGGTFNVTGSHTYANAGTYTFGVQVTDSSGNKASDNGTATVSPMLQPPHVTGVNPDSINEGEKFTITGTGFYPKLVTSVLVGGQKLAPTQFSTVSDTQLNAVAPAIHGNFLPVVVQTTEGVSNDDVTISIHP